MLSLLFGIVLLFHARYLAIVLLTTLLAYIADKVVLPPCHGMFCPQVEGRRTDRTVTAIGRPLQERNRWCIFSSRGKPTARC
jgi:hypothetical protein